MKYLLSYVILLFLFVPPLFAADMLIGKQTTYTAVRGDSLYVIGARIGCDWRIIASENGIDPDKPLRLGQQIRVNNRRIVPRVVADGIIINVPERMLYYFKNGTLVSFFPVGLGMSRRTKVENWQTPVGLFTVGPKEKDPIWHVPKSIQKEMETKGKPVNERLPPGEENPLGRFAVHTSIEGILIHETIWPTTVYQFRSHGCVRVLPDHMAPFFKQVAAGTTGEIIYEPVKVAVTPHGRVALEVHRDYYKVLRKPLSEKAKELIDMRGLSGKVNWEKVEKVVKEKSGVVRDVSR